MMILMPKKKAAKSAATHISFRLKPAELEPLDADRKALPGVPVARNTYARHAVLSYPGLRQRVERLERLESLVRRDAALGQDEMQSTPRELLEGAGL